jgi:hypothetical protein
VRFMAFDILAQAREHPIASLASSIGAAAVPKEPLIIAAISALAAQDEAFLDKVTSATVTHGALWPLSSSCRRKCPACEV